ncbi:hypothetical protein OsJ_10690 [Oryza sativa Japonica Group]|uniref:Uncharacterized protein n=1 Tax=Oryza sativa subsp. japonica TaxID=39947 RepID=B9F886_ORYSJ|nr:hypothetical protein OsJ_10690 [Oryza sativa Japonica Group]
MATCSPFTSGSWRPTRSRALDADDALLHSAACIPTPRSRAAAASNYRLRPGAPRAADTLLDTAVACTMRPCEPPPPCSRAADARSTHRWPGALLKPITIGVVVFDRGGGEAGGEKRELARHHSWRGRRRGR